MKSLTNKQTDRQTKRQTYKRRGREKNITCLADTQKYLYTLMCSTVYYSGTHRIGPYILQVCRGLMYILGACPGLVFPRPISHAA